jgi:hypothetical protein
MTEADWVKRIAAQLQRTRIGRARHLEIRSGLRLTYGYEIRAYGEEPTPQQTGFQTDLAVVETSADGSWKPRVVVEAKVRSISTHDAITYSHKAAIHRAVHPYLRYGVMLGEMGCRGLPGRLYRHGVQFDFMLSFRGTRASRDELTVFERLLLDEVAASRMLERLLYESRMRGRDEYNVLHRRLVVK